MWDTFLAKVTGTEVDTTLDRNALFVKIINILFRCSGIWAVLMPSCIWLHMVHEETRVLVKGVLYPTEQTSRWYMS